jgi:hypothetical protein
MEDVDDAEVPVADQPAAVGPEVDRHAVGEAAAPGHPDSEALANRAVRAVCGDRVLRVHDALGARLPRADDGGDAVVGGVEGDDLRRVLEPRTEIGRRPAGTPSARPRAPRPGSPRCETSRSSAAGASPPVDESPSPDAAPRPGARRPGARGRATATARRGCRRRSGQGSSRRVRSDPDPIRWAAPRAKPRKRPSGTLRTCGST